MIKPIMIIDSEEALLIYLFKFIMLGIIHKGEGNAKVKGIVLGLWRFQTQLTIGYSNEFFSATTDSSGYA